jgi:hypothetical protein
MAAIPAAAGMIEFFTTIPLSYTKDRKPQWMLRMALQNVKLDGPTKKASVYREFNACRWHRVTNWNNGNFGTSPCFGQLPAKQI